MQDSKSNPFFNHESVPTRNGTDSEPQRGYVKKFYILLPKIGSKENRQTIVIRFVKVSLPVFMKLQITIWVWMEIDCNVKFENLEFNSSRSSLVVNRFQIFLFMHYFKSLLQKEFTVQHKSNIKTTLNYINIKGKMCAVTKGAWAFELVTATCR